MKRFPILGVLLLIPALMLLGTVGCTPKADPPGKDAEDKGADKTGGDKGAGGKKVEITEPLEATVTGVVKIKGKAPEMKAIPAVAAHADKATCMADALEQTWRVSADRSVANVIVILGLPANKKPSAKAKDLGKKTVHVDQPVCQYVPHVVGVWGEVQPFVAKNSAPVNHNVKFSASGDAGNFDQLVPAKNAKTGEEKDTGDIWLKGLANETLINCGCSIHPWMNAQVAVFNHPYFAVTNDKGEFKIENVPIDIELTVYMWHESMGALKNKVEQKKMSFKKGDNSLGELEISAKGALRN